MATASVSHAVLISPGSGFLIQTGTSNANPEDALFSDYGAPKVYKSNVTGGGGSNEEDSSFVNSYTTVYSGKDPDAATISYDGGPSLGAFSSIYLLVKDGNHDPYWYFFDLGVSGANWNGTDELALSGFWPDNGSISHVTLFADGQRQPAGNPVPDGAGTVALLGMALMGLGGVRRFLAKA